MPPRESGICGLNDFKAHYQALPAIKRIDPILKLNLVDINPIFIQYFLGLTSFTSDYL